jgi:hypothetical protein
MKRVATYVAVTFVGLGLSISGLAMAQGMGMGMGKGMNMPTFADFDLNGDGAITNDEFNKARAERIAKNAKEGRQMKGLASMPTFADIDTDGNGSLSAKEFTAHQTKHHAEMHTDESQ